VKIEELFLGTFEKMETSHTDLLENAINLINERIAEIKSISFAVGS
jgi:phosphopantetheine adenylyltransferase